VSRRNNVTPPQTTAPGTPPTLPGLTPPPSQAPNRPYRDHQKLLSGAAAKAGHFLFEREPKTYELTVLPWFTIQTLFAKEWNSRSRVGISARAAICGAVKPRSRLAARRRRGA